MQAWLGQAEADVDLWYEYYGLTSTASSSTSAGQCGTTLARPLCRRLRGPRRLCEAGAPGALTALNPARRCRAASRTPRTSSSPSRQLRRLHRSGFGGERRLPALTWTRRTPEDLAHRLRRDRPGPDGAGDGTEQVAQRRLRLRHDDLLPNPYDTCRRPYWADEQVKSYPTAIPVSAGSVACSVVLARGHQVPL